jgi:hypothetical protein
MSAETNPPTSPLYEDLERQVKELVEENKKLHAELVESRQKMNGLSMNRS